MRQRAMRAMALALWLTVGAGAAAQVPADAQALTNADVLTMIASGLPESTIVASMRANPTDFDVTPAALIELNKAGVSARIMDAMIAAEARNDTRAAAAARAGAGPRGGTTARPAASAPAPNAPSVTLVAGDARQPVAAERTSLAQTAAKADSLGDLAKDRALSQGLRAGMSGAMRSMGNSAVGGAVGQTAGGVIGSLIANTGRSQDVTYVWAVEGDASQTTVAASTPAFEIAPGRVLGVRMEDYASAIVILTPTANGWRLVGATVANDTQGSRSVMDWPMYSGFMEERVAAGVTSRADGGWQIRASEPLPAGEYAVVMRPVSTDKRFSGADVARNQGDGVMFNTAWTFAVR